MLLYETPTATRKVMKFAVLLRYVTPHRRVLLTVILLLLAGSGAALAQPWLAGELTRTLLSVKGASRGISSILTLWLALMVLRSFLNFATRYYIGSTGEAMTASLRSHLFQHLQALPLAHYHTTRAGDVLALLSNDADHVSSFVTDTAVQLLPLLALFAGALFMMFLLDPVIAGLAVILLPAYALLMKVIGRRIRPISRAWVDSHSDLISFFSENLEMRPAVKAFLREPTEQQHFDDHNANLLRQSNKQLLIQSLLSPAVGLLTGLGFLLLLWLGTHRIASGAMTAPDLVSLILYALLLSQPIRGLADVYGEVQRTRGAAERILDFLNLHPEPDDSGMPGLPPAMGAIHFDNVNFQYPQGRPVLKNFNLHITAGETVAITGPNGSGKSTLVHLLMRLAEPDSGRILIDGCDISGVTMASLRGQIGLVAQHTLLINGSVAQNIAYGQPLAAQAQVEAAAKQAHAHHFINRLPQGYDTLIGDNGLRLSGGQRQRISLARTLLLNPPILVLDEATSMFDPAGEQSFIAECRALLLSKTVILITHRPASLALADRIIELEVTNP